ncbi:MAG: tetratricopeptide repeat protein [bacterium]
MRRLIFLIIIVGIGLYLYSNRAYWFLRPQVSAMHLDRVFFKERAPKTLVEGLELLKDRQDIEAWEKFERVIRENPDDLDALWGKAEVLRRRRRYEESQAILESIISKNLQYAPALITLSYIKYKEDKLDEAQGLIGGALSYYKDNDTAALAYMMLGTINARRAEKGNILAKIRYGTQISCYLLKAKELAPKLAEVRLALGTFYLVAPTIIGGNPDKALLELNAAVTLAPNFATANARLAQCYKKKLDLEKYNFYIEAAQSLDPENEVLKELNVQ